MTDGMVYRMFLVGILSSLIFTLNVKT